MGCNGSAPGTLQGMESLFRGLQGGESDGQEILPRSPTNPFASSNPLEALGGGIGQIDNLNFYTLCTPQRICLGSAPGSTPGSAPGN